MKGENHDSKMRFLRKLAAIEVKVADEIQFEEQKKSRNDRQCRVGNKQKIMKLNILMTTIS